MENKGLEAKYTAVDMASAAADGFRDGRASVVVDLSFIDIRPSYGWKVFQACKEAIIAAGGSVKE